MGFFSFLILGLIAGVIAKLILPGKQGGGWIAGFFIPDAYASFWSIPAWLVAIGGALVVLLIWGFITRGRRSKA